ncbi:MAG: exodeoxyribonuclease VII small subunit [Gammaproteobacteria bacterium]|jgi:exodeoxyribonuclease VII small subunit|tara:strand:+ start:3012 stop:3398 length:387 start_codon:yes stop_codon:yes gene_type:complete
MRKEVKKKYTEIIKELDLIISKLDSSDIPIEQSIKLHEKGVELSKEAEKELNSIENNIDKYKPNKRIQVKNINIEKSFHEIENLIKKLESENIKIIDAENNYKKALEIIFNIESYLKKAKSKVEKYEQ